MNQVHVDLQKSDLFRSIQDHAGNNFLQFSINEQFSFVGSKLRKINGYNMSETLKNVLLENCRRAYKILNRFKNSIHLMETHGLSWTTLVWKLFLSQLGWLKNEDRKWLELAQRLYEKHVPVFALVAYAIDPEFLGKELTEQERESAANWVQEFYPECFSANQNFTGLSIDHLERLYRSYKYREKFLEGLLELGTISAPFAAVGKLLTRRCKCVHKLI